MNSKSYYGPESLLSFEEVHSAASSVIARTIRNVKDLLKSDLRSKKIYSPFTLAFSPRHEILDEKVINYDIAERASWALLNMWLIGLYFVDNGEHMDFRLAEQIFFGDLWHQSVSLSSQLDHATQHKALKYLKAIDFDEKARHLLPYILDQYGPGSRASVIRDPRTWRSRSLKRDKGSYSTPIDVASFIVSETMASLKSNNETLRIIDPACGTGVFLKSAIWHLTEKLPNDGKLDTMDIISNSIFGFDIDILAIENCTFCLLHQAIASSRKQRSSIWSQWQMIRSNLAVVDSLRVTPTALGRSDAVVSKFNNLRILLKKTLGEMKGIRDSKTILDRIKSVISNECHGFRSGLELGMIFPEVSNGFDVIVCNPPYSRLGRRDDYSFLAQEYESFRQENVKSSDNAFLFFLEMTWRLTQREMCASGMVVPLSIAYHQGTKYKQCRKAIASTPGIWRFSFFDREPHALFGENVKLRNSIIFYNHNKGETNSNKTRVMTSTMKRWTSRSRDTLFRSLDYCEINPERIEKFVPKLSSELEARSFERLVQINDRFETLIMKSISLPIKQALSIEKQSMVIVGNTAYNFLNVYVVPNEKIDIGETPSESPVFCLAFTNEKYLYASFAILSSRVTYWLWWVQGDGFHVNRKFIKELPFGNCILKNEHLNSLSSLGKELWRNISDKGLMNINKGRSSITFNPISSTKIRSQIDSILIGAAELPIELQNVLEYLIRKNVLVDENESRRKILLSKNT